MQVIAVNSSASVADRVAVARSLIASVLMLVVGVALGWLCLGTPIVSGFMPSGRPSPAEIAGGILVWGFAIVVPAAFLILGFARLVSVMDALSGSRPKRVTPHLAQALSTDHLAATDLVLPGGRRLHEMVLGPFGIAVLGDVPPPSVTRHVGTRWEVRDSRGRWIPVENPVQRASRDAERVRSWLTGGGPRFPRPRLCRHRHRRPDHRAVVRVCGRADIGTGFVAGGAAGAARAHRLTPRAPRGVGPGAGSRPDALTSNARRRSPARSRRTPGW